MGSGPRQGRKEMRVALMNVIMLASDNLFNLFIAQ